VVGGEGRNDGCDLEQVSANRGLGYLLLGALAALLLFIGALGSGDRGIFAGVGSLGAISFVFKFFAPFFIVLALIGLLLFVPHK
jgi:hypothetical protein